MTTETRQRDLLEAEAIEKSITHYRMVVRTTQSTLENDRFYNDSLAALDKSIAELTRQREALVHARENAPQIIADARAKISELAEKARRRRAQRDVERIIELQREINGLQREEATP